MPLNFGRDVQGFNTFAANAPDVKLSATLAAAGHDDFTVPSSFQNWIVSFSFEPGSNIWVSINGTAAAPAGATFASTSSELLPGSRTVKAGDIIDVLNSGAGAADVGVQLYAIS